MKAHIVFQAIVFVGLLFSGILCLSSHKPEDFTQRDRDLYAQGITKLENQAPFENKEDIVAFVKALVENKSSAHQALEALAEFTQELGYFLLTLALFQGAAIWISLSTRR
jgi:hypothetical protein